MLLQLPVLAMVLLGGALGAVLRVAISRWMLRRFGTAYPLGTLLVNLSGALLIGLAFGGLLALFTIEPEDPVYFLLTYGLLGSYTTVSTLSLEWLLLVQQGRSRAAIGYLAASLVGGIALVLAGMAVASQAFNVLQPW